MSPLGLVRRPLRCCSSVPRWVVLGLVVGLMAAACGGGVERAPSGAVGGPSTDEAVLTGAGSTFLAPLVIEWARLYRLAAPGVSVEYAAVGSGAGIDRLAAEEADFAVSEVPLNPAELTKAGGPDVVIQLPIAAAPVVLAYNLAGVERLRLSANALAGIFSGRVARWDDAILRADNPDQKLPALAVTPVHRSESSGTTVAFTEYLRQLADRWTLGVARVIGFPGGVATSGADGVARAVMRTPGSVGYTSKVAAGRSRSALAEVENEAGRFVAPTTGAGSAALSGATGADSGLAVFVPPAQPGPAHYPIVAVTQLVFRLDSAGDNARAEALVGFADWILTEGQRSAESVGYLPLPYTLQLRSYEALKARSTRPVERAPLRIEDDTPADDGS